MSKKEKKIYYVPVTYEMFGRVPVEAASLKKAYDIIQNNADMVPLPINPEYVDGSLIQTKDMLIDEDEEMYAMMHDIYSDIYAEEPIFKPAKKNKK